MKDIHGNTIILCESPENSSREYLVKNNLIKKDGSTYKTVQMTHEKYRMDKSSYLLDSIKIIKKDETIRFVKNTIVSVNNKLDIDNLLNAFGDVTIQISDYTLHAPIKYDGHKYSDKTGQEFEYASSDDKLSDNYKKSFISWMGKDNGTLLTPVVDKFAVACNFLKRDMGKLTGYINIEKYLRMINKPSTFSLNVKNNNPILIAENTVKLTASLDVYGRILVLVEGATISSGNDANKTPYALFTTRPVNFGKESLPYSVVRRTGISVFISPFVGNSNTNLSLIKGGFDLLK